jgi:hypothetical protein
MAAGDTKHLSQLFLMGTNRMQIDFDFVLNDAAGSNLSLATDWTAAFGPVANLLSNEIANAGVRVADISSVPQVSILYEPTGADWTVGGVAGHSVPSSSALVVTKYTALRGKQNRGRMFLPGLPQTDQDQGVVDPTYRGTLQPIIDTFLSGISTTTVSTHTYVPSVFSYLGVLPGRNRLPSGITPVTSLFVTNFVRQQRRREVGVNIRGRRKTV